MSDDSDDGSLGSVEMEMEPDETEVIDLDSAEDEPMQFEEDEEGIQLIELDEAKDATNKQNGDTHKGKTEEKPKKSKKSDQSEDSDNKPNGPSEEDSGKSKKPKKKTYKDDESDESFYSNISPKELKSLKKNLMSEKDLDQNSIICTACYKQVNYKQEGAVLRHSDLAVPICKKCKKFYYKGSWKKDSEGFYEHCRWCGNGGDLMCCDECPNAFCKKCIKRNLGRSKVSEIENAEKWQCLACDPSQIAQQRALYYSIWTYTVKESKTEEQLKEQAKMRNKSKFVDEGHKGGFEVTRILNNYLQKSNKNWLQKTQGQVEQADVTKLVVKFRTIIKIAHHNLEMLDKNLVEGCTASYPDVTEEMLDAMTIPEDQKGETDEGPKQNGEKKKKPVKKKPAAKHSVLNGDIEEDNKAAKKNEEQKRLREKRNEERLAKMKEEETSSKVGNGEDLSEMIEDSASNDSERKENGGIMGKIVNEESVDSDDNKKTKKKINKVDKVDENSEGATQQNGEDPDAPDVSRDMFDSSGEEEQIKESTPELDDANKAARAFLLETSSDEECTDTKSGENKEPDEEIESEQKEIPKIKIKDLKQLQQNKSCEEEEDSKPGTKDGSPKKKLKTKRELDSLRRKSEEKPKEKAQSESENDEVKSEEKEEGVIKEEDNLQEKEEIKDKQDKKEKKVKTKNKAQAFTSSDSDDSDEDRLGIEGGTPEKKKSKKEEQKIKEKEEKKILEREKRKQERKEKNKDKEGKKKKKRDDSDSSEERVEGKVEKKLRKKAEKTLKKLRRKAEDIDINTPQLSKMKIRTTVVPLCQDIKDELEMDEFVDVTCHSNLYVAKETDDEDDIDRLCNFRSLKAVKKAVLGSSSDDDGEDNHTLKKSKGIKKEKSKEVGVADMSSGSDEPQSDGAESDNNPKNLCSSTPKKAKKTEAESSSEGDEHSEDSATEDGKKTKKEKKEKKTKAKEDDGSSDEATKKPKSKKLALLSMKLDEEDTSDEERKYREKMERKKAKDLKDGKNGSTDSSDEEQMSHATLHGSAKKKLSGKKRRRVLADTDEEDNDSEKSDDSDDSDDSSEEEAPKKKEPKKRGRKKASSSSEDSCEEKRPKKRKRIKGGSDDSEKEADAEENSPTKRHNIKKVIKDKNLAEETKSAQQTETERRERIKERQQKYNKIFGTEAEDKVKRAIADEVVLDFDEETKEVLVEVDKRLVKHLKPHQVGGVKFMWDSCFESIAQIEANKCPGGAILGHCMGLGKTLQSVTITHTVLTNSRVGVDRVMVLCPVNVVKNWADEFDKWLIGDLAVDVYEMSNEKDNHGRADKLECWFKEGGVLLIGYDMFRNLTNDTNKKIKPKMRATFTKCLLDPGADLIICDEGHLLKNEKSAINKAVNRIKTKKRIVLSGTPLQNNLKEYYEMVNFVKPNLMGTRKEFMNRFVNPIVNGQHTDSTEMDVKKMKKRSFILSDLLKGCMQRLDYNVLVPYLMPKLEYVLTIELTATQKTLYKFYLENYAKAGQIGNDGKLEGGKKGGLFYDKQNLSRIWNHPYILLLAKMKKDMKDDEYDNSGDEGSLKDFVVDSSEEETEESTEESTEDSEDSDASVKVKKKKKPTKRATRADKPTELATLDDKNVVQKMSSGGAWWTQHLADDQELDDLMIGSKMILLMDILKECAMIGDKLLVFSQSILSLDLIEEFLEKIHNENELTKKKNDGMDDVLGTWVPGKDYYRMDGSTAADTRKIWCKFFNKESNHRMRLFLISTKAGGLGINLVAANRVIIFDASWNPSHDVQSIFRVFRFGQTKPVYIYRFLAKGTMEEKIYDRQVTKQSMSARVVDEHQIDSHFTMNELTELYEFKDEPQSEKPTPIVPEDRLLAEIVDKHRDLVWNIHNHDSLLENKVDENLNEAERKAAWAEFENEKKGYVQQMSGSNNAWTAGLAQMQQQQAAMQQQINPMAIQAQLKMMYPEMNHEELMTRTRWTIMQMQQQMVNEMAARQKQQQEQQQLMQQQQLMRQAQQLSDQMRMAKQGSSGNTVRQQLSEQLRQAQDAQLRQQQALQGRGISMTKNTTSSSNVITIDEDGKEQ